MRTWLLYGVLLLVPGGWLAWLIYRWHARRIWRNGPHYVAEIQVLAPARPMALPPIRELKARPADTNLRMVRR